MTVQEAIANRRSIRKFTDQPVTRELLLELIEAARLSPSGCNSQPWRFRLITRREDIEWLGGPATAGQRWVGKAGAVIVCCVDTSAYLCDSRATIRALREAGLMTPEFAQDVDESYLKPAESGPPELLRGAASLNLAIAMSAMMLRAVELKLGTTWIGRLEERIIRERLGLPEGLGVAALMAVGHPAESPPQRPRKSLEEILV
ncbi:nitroreductase family protein [Fundidesulfovibrio putealis]|uniref:nitroreductase family protein n=1 Tax=Fundidesulfovibrio putealis TaxID=270496 RepID=UPI0004151F6E|nr:nitroreductase family protein [Fundidesulfovibrio putealis]